MLHLKLGRHAELHTLLNLEWLVFESSFGAFGGKVDGDGGPAFGVHGQGEDDAVARVVGVAEVFAAAAQTEGLLVALHCFVVGVWGGDG